MTEKSRSAAGGIRHPAFALGDEMRQRRDGRVFENQLRPQLGAKPFFELDDEVGGCRRIEAELGKARIGPDRDRRVIDGLLQIGDAPLADIGFGDIGRRQTILLMKDARWRMRARSRSKCGNQGLCRRRPNDTAYIALTPQRTLQSSRHGVKLRPRARSSRTEPLVGLPEWYR